MNKLRKRNLQRLATLSAVGAGAVLVTADKAEAGTIYWSGPLNAQVGWTTNGFQIRYRQSVGSSIAFQIKAMASRTSSRRISAYGSGNLRFAGGVLNYLQLFSPGAVWGTRTGAPYLLINQRKWSLSSTATFHYTGGDGSFTNKYALFEFNPGTGPRYGWIELSGSVTNAYGTSNAYGPSVTVEGWAYDTTPNEQLPAGFVPEPGTFALTGLAALALGAAGMRRWRAAKAC